MYLLIKTIFPLLCALFLFTCKASGPLTPAEAFKMARAAAQSSSYDVLADLLSKESIKKIHTTTSLFQAMPAERIEIVARAYGLSQQALLNLSVEDYLEVMLMDDQCILKNALKAEVTGIDQQGAKAIVSLHNGLFLDFVQEGPYWKLSIEKL